MKTLLFAFAFLLASPFSASAQWVQVNHFNERVLGPCAFPSPDTGYVLSQDETSYPFRTIFHTTDGGLNWTELNIPFTFSELFDISFPSNQIGYVAARNLATPQESMVFKTTDGGNSWSKLASPDFQLGYGLARVKFIDIVKGYFQIGGNIHYTADGGQNWSTAVVDSFGTEFVNDFALEDNFNGWLCGSSGAFIPQARLWHSTDNGASWPASLGLPFDYSQFNFMKSWLPNNLYVHANSYSFPNMGFLFKSHDNGMSWDTLPTPNGVATFAGMDHGVVFSGDTLYETFNGGLDWSIALITGGSLIHHVDLRGYYGWLTAEDGKIYTSFLGLATPVPARQELILAPNPADELVRIETESLQPGLYQIQWLNTAGQCLLKSSEMISGPTLDLSLGNWPAGTYLLHISNGKDQWVSSVIKK